MATTKVTFTLDNATITRLERAAETLAKPKSEIVRDAIHDYSDRIGKVSPLEAEGTFVARLPPDV